MAKSITQDILNAFTPSSKAEWEEKASKDLKGKSLGGLTMMKIIQKINQMLKYTILLVFSVTILLSCETDNIQQTENLIVELNSMLNEVVVLDGHKPPVVSRIFTYPNIAAYEILRLSDSTKYPSLLKGFNSSVKMPVPDQSVNVEVAALYTFISLSVELVYRDSILENFLTHKMTNYQNFPKNELESSIEFAAKVSDSFVKLMSNDGYNYTRTLGVYNNNSNLSSWKPTPPKYSYACEPYWSSLVSFCLDSINQFLPLKHTEFDTAKQSQFYNNAMEVYTLSKTLSKEQIEIARFWDDNPSPIQTNGHNIKVKKQLSPPGHWMLIASDICMQENLNQIQTSLILSTLSVSMSDAFKSTWHAKYYYDLLRPITYINRYIDSEWQPLLENPMFPEYTSAHSTISGAAATVLSHFFDENYALIDSTELPYGHAVRSFSSFNKMALEVSNSRVYGGIHYQESCDNGLSMGKKIGDHILTRLHIKNFY